jgi:hypothetical protein
MRASVGDRIVVASTVVDQNPRDGLVVEVRHPDGSPPYLVEWSDTGERTLVFPGPDAHIEHPEAPAAQLPAEPRRVRKTWTVTVTIAEEGDETTATAVLSLDQAAVDAVGHARRNPHDPSSPVIGDEVAVSRALRHLADRLIETADEDIRSHTGNPARLYE